MSLLYGVFTWVTLQVNLHGLFDCCINIVLYRVLTEEHIYRERSSRNDKYWHVTEELRKLVSIHGSACHNELQVVSACDHLETE